MDLDTDIQLKDRISTDDSLLQNSKPDPQGSSAFLAGVVEGFYGRPWSDQERKDLISTLNLHKLSAYIYAPKDDVKHRRDWRILYDAAEIEKFTNLIEICKFSYVKFIYTISPGHDITYSSQIERNLLIQKLEQIIQLGADGIGIFFDDIEVKMNETDREHYDSFAQAQTDITNYLYLALDRPDPFLFCPTEYCTSRSVPNLISSKYLNYIGANLINEIHIMWTGPRVISRTIPVEHIETLVRVLKRKPVIWDNLNANDYDRHNIFLGPYQGRPIELFNLLSGIFINPNCQYDLNFIPINSFCIWVETASQNLTDLPGSTGKPLSRSRSFSQIDYNVDRVFRDCCKLWANEFTKQINFSDSSEESAPLITDDSIHRPDFNDSIPNHTDIFRIASFYYLPGQLGPYAKEFYSKFCLIIHSSVNFWQKQVNDNFNQTLIHENRRANFKRNCDKILNSIRKINKSPNIELRKLLFIFLNEIKETIFLMRSYIKFLESKEIKNQNLTFEPDSLINHSRFATEIQKLLPSFLFCDVASDVQIEAPVFVIRPPHDYDLERLETVCYGHLINKFGSWDDLRPSKDLTNLRYLATFLRAEYEMFVIEDSDNLCGYMIYKVKTEVLLEEQLEVEYNAYVLSNLNLEDHVLTNYIKYPTVVGNIFDEYPMRLQFCFQVGFKKTYIFQKLMEYVMRKMVQFKIKGVHVIIDKFELVEPALLKKHGFRVHPNGNLPHYKYYVLENKCE